MQDSPDLAWTDQLDQLGAAQLGGREILLSLLRRAAVRA
jgi:hypothetical protein